MSKTTIKQLYGIDAKSLVGISHEDALKMKIYNAFKHRETLSRHLQEINTEGCSSCELLLIFSKEIVKLDNAIDENLAELNEMGITYSRII